MTAFWAVVFILVFVIDLEQGLILNKVVYPSMVVALLFAGFLDPPWMEDGALESFPDCQCCCGWCCGVCDVLADCGDIRRGDGLG